MGGFTTRSHPSTGMVLRERVYALKSIGGGVGSTTRGGGNGTHSQSTGGVHTMAAVGGGAVESRPQNPPSAPLQRLWSGFMGGGRQPPPVTAGGTKSTSTPTSTSASAGWNDVTTIALDSFPLSESESVYGLVAVADDATVR